MPLVSLTAVLGVALLAVLIVVGALRRMAREEKQSAHTEESATEDSKQASYPPNLPLPFHTFI